VTWLTNQNCHAGVLGKFPTDLVAEPTLVLLLALLPFELHAASNAEAAAVALTSPVPFRSRRRVSPSAIFRVWIASSTLGSTSLIANLHVLGG
jgi:hypothetical protein